MEEQSHRRPHERAKAFEEIKVEALFTIIAQQSVHSSQTGHLPNHELLKELTLVKCYSVRMLEELWERGDYTISTDPSRLNIDLIHDYISNHSYWGSGRARDVVQRSIENSMPFGVYRGEQQVGFARIVTDYATFAWVADVFIVPEHRGRGLSKWLMEIIIAHPRLQGFRRWVLATKDAQGLYERFGFIKLHRPERWMERPDPKMQESPDYWQP